MKQDIELVEVRTYWKPECNEFYTAPIHRTITKKLTKRLAIFKSFLVLVTFLWLPLLIVAAFCCENNQTIIALCTGLPGLVCASCMLFWFKYTDMLEKFVEPEKQQLRAELAEEHLKLTSQCEAWRKEHPLEEKVRLALTKNPNYVADLIRSLQGNNNE